jgi:hypothetical protein
MFVAKGHWLGAKIWQKEQEKKEQTSARLEKESFLIPVTLRQRRGNGGPMIIPFSCVHYSSHAGQILNPGCIQLTMDWIASVNIAAVIGSSLLLLLAAVVVQFALLLTRVGEGIAIAVGVVALLIVGQSPGMDRNGQKEQANAGDQSKSAFGPAGCALGLSSAP